MADQHLPRVERPGDPAVQPTTGEFLDWFLSCPRWQQEEMADSLLLRSEQGMRCFMQDHDRQLHAWARANVTFNGVNATAPFDVTISDTSEPRHA